MKIYLAGPMSGIDQGNFPLFDDAAEILRVQGFDVVSPAELDDPETRRRVLANERCEQSWGDFLSRDIKLLADGGIEGIVFLPGWEKSRGARLEAFVGLTLGFKFWDFAEPYARGLPRWSVIDVLAYELRKVK